MAQQNRTEPPKNPDRPFYATLSCVFFLTLFFSVLAWILSGGDPDSGRQDKLFDVSCSLMQILGGGVVGLLGGFSMKKR
jgi:hypothetical protein